VHHASNTEYLDRNYGGILIIWDRIFGTFAEEQQRTKGDAQAQSKALVSNGERPGTGIRGRWYRWLRG
jgi:sterol desaturase/sphingolipid hydroxylase (fatty acid hydroxylase superfamily)